MCMTSLLCLSLFKYLNQSSTPCTCCKRAFLSSSNVVSLTLPKQHVPSRLKRRKMCLLVAKKRVERNERAEIYGPIRRFRFWLWVINIPPSLSTRKKMSSSERLPERLMRRLLHNVKSAKLKIDRQRRNYRDINANYLNIIRVFEMIIFWAEAAERDPHDIRPICSTRVSL